MTVYNPKQVEAMVLIRDGLTMTLDGVNRLLELEEPKETKKYDLSKVKTEKTEGPSGFYQKATEQDSQDYRLLIEDLKQHDGKLTRDGMFIWLFSDGKAVGMKPSKK
jgi:hypothetical protein